MKRWVRSKLPKDREELKDWLKGELTGIVYTVGFYFAVALILYFGGQLFLSPFLAEVIQWQAAIEMLKTIAEVNGVLIGFAGLLAVYAFSEVSRVVEKAQQNPYAWQKHKETIEIWSSNLLWLLAGIFISLVSSILFSLGVMSFSSSDVGILRQSFVLPFNCMLLGIAGILWMIRSARNPLKV
ncbi:hypothetical protein MUP05_11410 [Candidatus Bathyarchaeota archaeon]|nr:hypothetical protein [Candidatus Bathyarchaeota archaeon]